MSRLGRTFLEGRQDVGIYSPTSFYNRRLSDQDTLSSDQSQAQHLANIIYYGRQSGYSFQGYGGIGYGATPWPYSIGFNLNASTFVMYVVDSSNSTPTDIGLWVDLDGGYPMGTQYNNLQDWFWNDHPVPIPNKALCPQLNGWGGSQASGALYYDLWTSPEGVIVIWNRDTDEMWEMFQMVTSDHVTGGSDASTMMTRLGVTTLAGFGGYTPSASNFSGVFPNGWGARGTSLGAMGGMITMQDLRDVNAGGTINHALCLATGFNGGGGTNVPPATRADGQGPLGNYWATIPPGFPSAGSPNPAFHNDVTHEGTRFRFPSNVDLSSSLIQNYPLAYAIATAIRDYGLYIVDTTGNCAFYMENPRTLGSPYHWQGAAAVNPWDLSWPTTGPGGKSPYPDPRYGGQGIPSNGWTVLNNLPWNQLQVLNQISS